jgi:hypothetical protein
MDGMPISNEHTKNTTGYVYKVVKGMRIVEMFDTKEELLAKYTKEGVVESLSVRPELYGQPRLEGLLGAMYDGRDEDGNAIIRYESQEVYDIVSS